MIVRVSKKRVTAIASVILALFVVLGVSGFAQPAQASPQALIPLPTITLTVTKLPTAPVIPPPPDVTIVRPTVTVTKVITQRLPRATTTVTLRGRNVPQPVRTVRVPGPVTTVTSVPPRQTVTSRATITRQPVTVTATSTVTATKTTPPKDAVVLTRTKTAALSLLLIIIGVLLAVALSWASFTYGWFKGDSGNREFIKDTIDDLRYDK